MRTEPVWLDIEISGRFVNTVMKLRFRKRQEISSPVERILASQEGLCSMKLVIIRLNFEVKWQA
jgi:hypothetical protein